ncbi:LuxR family maltose regulon positive regulatory protein [Nocardia neocaledoniensis]|uniref:LuxR family maltose regulon positive regulatory protein n=2 Tax=Nocardia neocaledoniensis TaxID=236511 RepID=A0A317NZ73_9NOCA|nr:LuxR family maltose regulon positive regulatory protein [Nocardia neocaledoniensis]
MVATSYRAIAEGVAASRIPELSFTSVRSTELAARLDHTPSGHTVLMCAPAGTGKTVALVDWVTRSRRARAVSVAWLTVTEQLAEGGELIPAIARALDRAGEVADGALCTPVDQAADLALALSGADPSVLVLDDAHLLRDPLQLAGLEHLLTHLPATVTVLVAARFDPPLRWHALELDGRLLRIGGADLALSPDRIARLFAQHGCLLDDDELALVSSLTRGWAALVRIAAIYLAADPEDRDTALATLARPSHAVADFLVAELMAALPAETLEFLLVTAVPARFCLPLAEELAGEGAARVIDELSRANFPMHTVADGGELWYSYHPLLRAYLLAEAAHTRAERLPALHRRVAAWFGAAALPGPALEHVLAEPGAPGLAGFLREWGPRLVLDGAGHRLLAAVEHVPELAEDTFVRLLRAAVAIEAGESAAAEVYLEAAHVGSGAASRLVPAAWTDALDHAVSAGVAVLVGDSASMRWPLPEVTGQADLDCFAALHCGCAEVSGGALDSGVAALRHAIVHAEEVGLGRTAVRARTALAVAAGLAGRIGEQYALAEAALDCADRHDLSGAAETIFAATTGAYAAHQRGEQVTRVLGVLPGDAEFEIATPAPLRQAAIVTGILAFADATDRASAATALAKQLHRLLDETPTLLGTDALVTDVLWLLLRVQAKIDAQQLVEHAVRVLGDTPETLVAAAGLALSTQRPTAALALLEPLLAGAPTWRSAHEVTAWLVVAVAAERLDRPRKVDDALAHALALASGDQLIRPFLDVPGAAETLDRLSGRFGHHDAFADQVRALRGPAADAPHLTDTEFAVLRQLPSGMTAVTIAAGLGVSVNTVKTHLRGIYQKLGVNARADAIATARALGLI